MRTLRLLFSSAGRLPRRAFIIAVVALYLVAAASQALTMPGVIKSAGLWPVRLAIATSLLYVLSVALLVILAGAFYGASALQGTDANAASALELILFVSIIAVLSGQPPDSLAWLMVAILVAIAYLPLVLAAVTTAWAATRPTAQGPAP
jgi:hypothetical protein